VSTKTIMSPNGQRDESIVMRDTGKADIGRIDTERTDIARIDIERIDTGRTDTEIMTVVVVEEGDVVNTDGNFSTPLYL